MNYLDVIQLQAYRRVRITKQQVELGDTTRELVENEVLQESQDNKIASRTRGYNERIGRKRGAIKQNILEYILEEMKEKKKLENKEN